MKEYITLNWQPVFNYKEFNKLKDLKNSAYIYLWLIKVNNDFIPYYVGKAQNIKSRIFTHLTSQMGGGYTIHQKELLNEFYDHKKAYAYSPKKYIEITEFIDDWLLGENSKYRIHLKEIIINSFFTYAEIENKDALADIESSVISSIGIDRLDNIKFKLPEKYFHISSGDEKIVKMLNKY
jgi:hypothetical protein